MRDELREDISRVEHQVTVLRGDLNTAVATLKGSIRNAAIGCHVMQLLNSAAVLAIVGHALHWF